MHAEETLSTLKFATRAKSIQNTATVNEVLDDQVQIARKRKRTGEEKIKKGGKRKVRLWSFLF